MRLLLAVALAASACHPAVEGEFGCHAGDVGTLTALSGQRRHDPLVGRDTPTLRGVWATAPYLHDGSDPRCATCW
jgi:hypothetical protein